MTGYLEPKSGSLDPADMKDEDVLYRSQREPALFEVLVERYQEPLMRAALRVVRRREEAEDIVQEAFVKMYRYAGKFEKMDGIEFKSWAYKIAINTAITHYRKLKRGGEMLAEDPAIFQEAGEELAEARFSFAADAKAAVAKTLARMPDHLRSVLHRYYMEDKSYKTIAEEEEISIPTLKMRLFRAKKLFKKINKEDGDHIAL